MSIQPRDRGSVTAETATVLPVLAVVLLAAVWVLVAVGTHVRCVDAAALAARAAARGDAPADVNAAARRLAPDDAEVLVTRSGDEVHVAVSVDLQPFGRLGALPALPISARAVAVVEPGVAP